MFMDKVNEILDVVSAHDEDLYAHLERTAVYAIALAKQLGLPAKEMETVYFAGLLHDIGKVVARKQYMDPVVQRVLEKNHYMVGYYMLAFIPDFEHVATIIKHHHERFDGTGIPDKLEGTCIPYLTRILTIADAYDKMRVKGMSFEEAAEELREHSGVQFDPALIEPFLQALQEEELTEGI